MRSQEVKPWLQLCGKRTLPVRFPSPLCGRSFLYRTTKNNMRLNHVFLVYTCECVCVCVYIIWSNKKHTWSWIPIQNMKAKLFAIFIWRVYIYINFWVQLIFFVRLLFYFIMFEHNFYYVVFLIPFGDTWGKEITYFVFYSDLMLNSEICFR